MKLHNQILFRCAQTISTSAKAMSENSKIFISHTTHDKRDHALAHKLAHGLRERGPDVWIAPDNIPVGSEWEPEIVKAIITGCTHFLVILSAASTAAEWVLKEIALAKDRRENDACFTILPLVVGTAPAYPEQEFIDQFQCVGYFDDFSAQLDAVARSLNLRPDVPNRFTELTQHFVGREYVFSAIEDFIQNTESGYFTVIGDPGEGKTAILAEFVKRSGCVAHFNRRSDGVNRAEHCITTISAQITARFGLSIGSPPSDPSQFGQHWDDLFKDASSQLDEGERIIIAIDALDEVELFGQLSGANILLLPRLLPEGVHIILTSRRVEIPFVVQSAQQVFDLFDHREESLVDLKTYLEHAVSRLELNDWISRQRLDVSDFIDALANKSEYNFMYLHYVLPEIAKGAYATLDLEELPHGLRGYYDDHWQRMGMRADPLPREKIRIVYVMAEVRRPVSRSLIADFADQDPVFVQQVINDWRQFLHEQAIDGESRYSVYHTSFLDFLHDKEIVQAAGETIEGIHATIADNLWQELMGED